MSGVSTLSSGSEVWAAIHNHCPELLRLHAGQNVGTLEIVAIADSPPPPAASKPFRQPPVLEHLSPIQQQQLKDLFQNSAISSAKERTILPKPHCCNTPLKPKDSPSASPIVAKTLLSGEKKWPRSNRC